MHADCQDYLCLSSFEKIHENQLPKLFIIIQSKYYSCYRNIRARLLALELNTKNIFRIKENENLFLLKADMSNEKIER